MGKNCMSSCKGNKCGVRDSVVVCVCDSVEYFFFFAVDVHVIRWYYVDDVQNFLLL